jgi:hypothetical protein
MKRPANHKLPTPVLATLTSLASGEYGPAACNKDVTFIGPTVTKSILFRLCI